MKKYKKKTIKWRDANAFSGWWHIEDMEPLAVESTGYVVRDDKECIILAAAVAENGQVNAAIYIPKQWIIK